jgi:hypothetical protein
VDEADLVVFTSALSGYRRTNRDWLVRRLADELITNWTVAGPALLYAREPIISVGGYDADLLVEDWDFYLKLASRGWLRFVDRTVAAYRLHERNEHRNPQTQLLRDRELSRVALRAARRFRGRRQFILLLQAIGYSPPLMGLQPGKLTDLPGRAVSRVIRMSVRALASLG